MSKTGLGLAAGLALALGAAGCRYEVGGPGYGNGGCNWGRYGKSQNTCACADGGPDWSMADQACVPFCNRLMTCGLVGSDRMSDCLDFCRNQYDVAQAQTEAGCGCVVNDSCRAATQYQCPGAPIPPADYHAGGSSSGSASSSSGSTGTSSRSCTTVQIQNGVDCYFKQECSDGYVFIYDCGSSSGSSSGSGSATAGSSSSSSGGSSSSSSGSTAGACTRNLDCAYNQDCVSGECLNRCHASCECATGQSCTNGYCVSNVPPPQSCAVDCECNAGQHCVNSQCQ